MNFSSDNVTGAHPAIVAALAEAAGAGAMPAYGADPLTEGLGARFAEIFEHEVAVFPVATGTAANALALSALVPPWGGILAGHEAHVEADECGAVEALSGARIMTVHAADGKLTPAALAARLAPIRKGDQHQVQPAAISITQATECGTVYTPAEVAALGAFARENELRLHMDGARFANALVGLGCTPAEITWKAGVDVLSFGATKNGALAAEAVIFFEPTLAENFLFRRKRAGHLVSKMRFLSAQLAAYLDGDLWRRNAAHANRMATDLALGLIDLPGVDLDHPVDANEVFVRLPAAIADALFRAGFHFYPWGAPPLDPATEAGLYRLVTAFDTAPAAVAAFIAAATRAAKEIA
ncbi:threonine aldolase family protein [Zavarzinia compransoris]|uniref:L-threonine aldolase n=1 Tax=Zavarzinia compransoris TaxID=1264899 RepID=A0A317E5R5_9PROT|nr:beta-eliminating lyase-related protein [Zavarzinia compransoris]PWR21694.1 low specificity L-threonine aldolase [Zavarzinia compransoris]TDP45520.1 L-threonine aldolase [Zavarzinia compransoris]